jgi:hypothetical protein
VSVHSIYVHTVRVVVISLHLLLLLTLVLLKSQPATVIVAFNNSVIVSQLTAVLYKAVLSLLFSFMVIWDLPGLSKGYKYTNLHL